jgi:hypothetical protein
VVATVLAARQMSRIRKFPLIYGSHRETQADYTKALDPHWVQRSVDALI